MTDSAEAQRALIARAIADDHADLIIINKKIDKLAGDVETLMELFKGAKGVVRIVTWIGGIAGILSAIVAALAPYFTFNHTK